MADLFLSYSKSDHATAERLVDDLQRYGVEVWWDSHLLAGDRYHERIVDELNNAKFVILLWSSRSANSDYVKIEVEEACKRQKLIPLRLDETELPIRIGNMYHAGDLRNWNDCIAAVLERLGIEPLLEEEPSFACFDAPTVDPQMQAAWRDLSDANWNLGQRLAASEANDPVRQRGWLLIEHAARLGHSGAMVRLAEAYVTGEGGAKVFTKAFALAAEAHRRGQPAATTLLAFCYDKGRGIRPDPERACALFEAAADRGDSSAQWSLGLIHMTGRGAAVDFTKARAYLERAASQGHCGAICDLGRIYEDGLGVRPDHEFAKRHYEMAWDGGFEWAALRLGQMLTRVDGDADGEHAREARLWFQRGADVGLHWCTWFLGRMYEDGQGGSVDRRKAIELYELAAAQGNHWALWSLAQAMRAAGPDHVQAENFKRVLETAAEQGNVGAMLELADAYEQGDLLTQSAMRAREWFGRAADKGATFALWRLAILLDEERGGPYEPDRATALLQAAIAAGLEPAIEAKVKAFASWSPRLRTAMNAKLPP